MRKWIPFLFLLLTLLLPLGQQAQAKSLPPFHKEHVPAAPDYSTPQAWLALPENPNAHPVDVFWVYPTVLHDTAHWLMGLNNEEAVHGARNTLRTQASVFDGIANIYAPFYRQMNMAGLKLSPDKQEIIFEYAKTDVRTALEYYLKNYNNGRPFILAGHSQGSNILADYAVKNWGKIGVEDKLVAAYLIGWSITKPELASNHDMHMCESATQTDCFISYNSVAAGKQGAAPTIRPEAVVTNPLSWTTDDAPIPAWSNLGARFFHADGTSELLPHFTSAQAIHGGLVVAPRLPDKVRPHDTAFPPGVYHVYDYSLFYENLRRNAARRVDAMLNR